jgi:hypothetical protein
MKRKILSVLVVAGLTSGVASAVTLADAAKADVEKICDIKAKGIEAVLKTAGEYNELAKKLGVEFKRKGVTTSGYIAGTSAAVKAKQKDVTLTYKKKGKEKHHKFTVEYAAWRACHFGVRAVQQVNEAEKTWRMAIPGDGFKF